MFEVRLHGRGGQGVVTAAELLSEAAFAEGRHAQAFPSFGSERTGAPVVSYCRIGDEVIRTREPVMEPHALVVQDATLLHQVDVFAGLRSDGWVLINSRETPGQLGIESLEAGHVLTVDATNLARQHVGRPMPNAALLGGLAAMTGIVHLDAVAAAIRAKFPGGIAEGNVSAAQAAYDLVSARKVG
ncbi:2-oxoacid:acceptor oxidoreductase [Nocardioides piscis]|uniref:2-oxoacid:acceptor oxidoreductase n=1 Tax=Nocardioides piscis TaxID=2714938 RepID=A0A6G7YL72_9ACTN|nr:2-oxoacid:acceptor oxidoreductase [Nocardioides piscis]